DLKLDFTIDNKLRQIFQRILLWDGWCITQGAEGTADRLSRFVHCKLDRFTLTDSVHQALDAFGIFPSAFGQGQDITILGVCFSVVNGWERDQSIQQV